MKVAIVLLVVAVASAYASYDAEYGQGFQHTANGIVSAYRNDQRQVNVNRVADYIGSGIGTGRFYGVPGTNGHYSNYGYGYDNGYNNGYNGYNAYNAHNTYANDVKEVKEEKKAYNAVPYYGAGYTGYGYGVPSAVVY